MSANNMLLVFRMDDGSFRVFDVDFDSGIHKVPGRAAIPVATCGSYEELFATLDAMGDEDSPAYRYVECGGPMPTRERLEREPAHFAECLVEVAFAGRACGCVDGRDLLCREWEVREYSSFGREGAYHVRVVAKGLWFAEAVARAGMHASTEPGACVIQVPEQFLSFKKYDEHSCWDDRDKHCRPHEWPRA